MSSASSRTSSPERPLSARSIRSDTPASQDGRTTRMTIQTSSVRQSPVSSAKNAISSSTTLVLHPSNEVSASLSSAPHDKSASTPTPLLRPPVGLGKSVVTSTEFPNPPPRTMLPEPPIAFLVTSPVIPEKRLPRKGKDKEKQKVASRGKEKETEKRKGKEREREPANQSTWRVVIDNNPEREKGKEKEREKSKGTGKSKGSEKHHQSDKGKRKEKKKPSVPKMDPLCAPNAPYLGIPDGSVSFRVHGYHEVPTRAAEPAPVPRNGPYDAQYRVPPPAPPGPPPTQSAPPQPRVDPGPPRPSYYRRNYEQERLNTPARRAKLQAELTVQDGQPVPGPTGPSGASIPVPDAVSASAPAPMLGLALAPATGPAPIPVPAYAPTPAPASGPPASGGSSYNAQAYPTAHTPAPALHPSSSLASPQYSPHYHPSEYPNAGDNGALQDLPPPLSLLRTPEPKRHDRPSRHAHSHSRDQYTYPPPDHYPQEHDPVPLQSPQQDAHSNHSRRGSRAERHRGEPAYSGSHLRSHPGKTEQPPYDSHNLYAQRDPPPSVSSLDSRPPIPLLPAALLLTLLVEDQRADPPDNQIAEVTVALRSEGSSLWVDAKDLCTQLQASASRIDGSVKVYTMRHTKRGKFKQYFMRVTSDGEVICQSMNLSVDQDLTLEIFVEEIPTEAGKTQSVAPARTERSTRTPSTQPRMSASPVARSRPIAPQGRDVFMREDYAYDNKPLRPASRKRQHSMESVSSSQGYAAPRSYSPAVSHSSYPRQHSPETYDYSYTRQHSPATSHNSYYDRAPAYPQHHREALHISQDYSLAHSAQQRTQSQLLYHPASSHSSRRVGSSYPAHARYSPGRSPSPSRSPTPYPPQTASSYAASPDPRTAFPPSSISPELQYAKKRIGDPPPPAFSPSPSPVFDQAQDQTPSPSPPPQSGGGFMKYASAYPPQQSSYPLRAESASAVGRPPPKKIKMDTGPDITPASNDYDAWERTYMQPEAASRPTTFQSSSRITSFHVSARIDSSSTPLADAAGAPPPREIRGSSPIPSRAPFPSASQSEVDVAVATYIKSHVSQESGWNEFARKRNSILSMAEQLEQYRYMKGLFDRFEGKRTPYSLHGAPNAEISKIHVLRAFNLQPDWGDNCLEMLQLAGMYGPGGSRCEDARVVKMVSEVPPISTGIQVKKFLSLLRDVHMQREGERR